MAKGWITDSSRPAGRRSFAEGSGVVKSEIIRPGKHTDGQNRDGTPPRPEITKAANSEYTSAAARKYRNALRGIGDKGTDGGTFGSSNNPIVHSKATKRYGADGSKLDGATFKSTGSQPAPMHRGSELAARLRGRDVSKAGTIKSQIVGHAPDGSGHWIEASHPNSSKGKHTGHANESPRTGDSSPLDRDSYAGGKDPGAAA
jgi:hypothetical protein